MTAPTAPAASLLCPECGAPADQLPSLRAHRAGLAPWLPRLGLLAVLVLFLGGAYFGQQRWSTNLSPTWAPAAGGLTIADLDAIARGTGDGSALINGLREFTSRPLIVGDEPVKVRLMPPAGVVYESTMYGWPASIVTNWTSGQYEDVFARTGPVARDWGVRRNQFWNKGSTSIAGAPPAAVQADWTIYAPDIALVLTLLLAGWYGGRAAPTLWRRARKKPRGRTWPHGLAAASLVAAAIAFVTLLTPTRTTRIILDAPVTSLSAPRSRRPDALSTGWTVDALRDELSSDNAATAIATRLQWLIPPRTDPSLVLEFGILYYSGPSAATGLAGFPARWFMWDQTARAPPAQRPGLRFNGFGWRSGELSYTRRDGWNARTWDIMTPELAMYILMAWLTWHAMRGLGAVIHWLLARRRHARGRCPQCGYDLTGLTA